MTYEKLVKLGLMFRWMQEMDLDVMQICSSPKGFGKSSEIIQAAIAYLKLFGLYCESCKHEFIYTGKVFSQLECNFISSKKEYNGMDVPAMVEAINSIVVESCPKCGKPTQRVTWIDFSRYLAYDNDELEKLIDELPEYSPILGDEAVRIMMGEDWNKFENKEMKKKIAQIRPKHLILLVNIPKFAWIDKKYKNDMATAWVRILQRGLALVCFPDLGEGLDPWHMKEFEECLGTYFFFTPKNVLESRAEFLAQKHPCVYDWFRIPPVPANIYAEYLRCRQKKMAEDRKAELSIDQKSIAKVAAWNLLNRWEEFVGAIKSSRFKKPTLKLLEGFVFSNPHDESVMVRHTTIRNWVNEVARIMRRGGSGPELEEKPL